MSGRYLFAGFLFISIITNAQIDSKKLDSLRRSIDSSIQSHRNYNDSFNQQLESMMKAARDSSLREAMEHSSRSTADLAEERRAKEKKAFIQRIAIGIGLLAILIIGLLLKRRKHQDPS
jgi:hypothetical protein